MKFLHNLPDTYANADTLGKQRLLRMIVDEVTYDTESQHLSIKLKPILLAYKENDKWYCRFKIHGQQKHLLCQGARSKAQAEAIEDAEKFKLRQAQAGLVKYLKPIVFHKLLDKYLKWAEINKKSYTTDVCRVKKIKEYFPNKLITEITVGEIEQFKANLTCGETTANKYLSLLSKVFNIAISEGYMEKNLCESITYFKKQNYGTRYLTDNEEQRLMKVLPQYLKDIVEVALHTGLRKSNILEYCITKNEYRSKNKLIKR